MAADPLDNIPSLTVRFELASGDAGVEALSRELKAFDVEIDLAEASKTVAALKLRVESKKMTPGVANNIVLMRVVVLANADLSRRSDPRRVARVLSVGGKMVDAVRWVIVSPEKRRSLERDGVVFDSGTRMLKAQLISLPFAIAFGIFIVRGAKHGETSDWVAAAICYALWLVARRIVKRVIGSR